MWKTNIKDEKSEVINFSLHHESFIKIPSKTKIFISIPWHSWKNISSNQSIFQVKPVCYATPIYFQLSAPLQSRCCQCTTYTWLTFWHMKWGLMYSKMINYGIFADVWLKKNGQTTVLKFVHVFLNQSFFGLEKFKLTI